MCDIQWNYWMRHTRARDCILRTIRYELKSIHPCGVRTDTYPRVRRRLSNSHRTKFDEWSCDLQHISLGVRSYWSVGLLLKNEQAAAGFNLTFGLIDLYQALASVINLPPRQYFLCTRVDDVVHVVIGLALLAVGIYGLRKRDHRLHV